MGRLRKFRKAAASYGADLSRWPAALRPREDDVFQLSAEARAALEHERTLDEALATAADLGPSGAAEERAALMRLRLGVAAAISTPSRSTAGTSRAAVLRFPFVWTPSYSQLAVASMAICVTLGGYQLGAARPPIAPTQNVMSIIDPEPVQFLVSWK